MAAGEVRSVMLRTLINKALNRAIAKAAKRDDKTVPDWVREVLTEASQR